MARKRRAAASDQAMAQGEAPVAAAAVTQADLAQDLDRLEGEADALRRERDEARAQAEERLQGWQRAQADHANYRRRVEQEKVEQVKYAGATALLDLLSAVDDFERAWAALPAELRGLTWIGGIFQIHAKLQNILRAHGVTPLEALGKPFDPYYHEAVLQEDRPAEELTHVVSELQRGYQLHDRVLRPSLVKVGKAPALEPPQQSAEGSSEPSLET